MTESNENSAIAGQIMTPYVIKLDIDCTFKEVIRVLKENEISAVFIEDPNKYLYFIITKTDIIKFLNDEAIFDSNLPNVSVKSIMNGPISMIDINTPIDNIIRHMIEHSYKRVLISQDNKPVGVVSTRDIMKWNNTYFKPAKPQILLFMDNINSTFIAKHIYDGNIKDDDVKQELIDIYGGALTSISAITDEILDKSGSMRQLLKDKRSILFESFKGITGILISDYNSIELRRKLQIATQEFYKKHSNIIDQVHEKESGISSTLDIEDIVPIFKENQK